METAPTPEESPLVEEIKMLMKLARDRWGPDAFAERQVAFAQQLKAKYPDCARRRAYHALAGSTVWEGAADTIEEDFPGEDSVAEFLQSLAMS
jgi:hypothetical protein